MKVACVVAAVLLCVLSVTADIPSSYSVKCIDRAWWALVPVDKELLAPLLPLNVHLMDQHPYSNITGKHPVLFELGVQTDCTPKVTPFLKTTFLEFKMEIPYTFHYQFGGPLMFKPVIYASTYSDAVGAHLAYGLNTLKAQMAFDETTYNATYKGKHISARFSNVGDFKPVESYPEFSIYEEINRHPWLCSTVFGKLRCASNTYDWKNTQVRPATMELSVEGGLLPGIKDTATWSALGVDQPLGAVQLVTPLYISYAFDCDKA